MAEGKHSRCEEVQSSKFRMYQSDACFNSSTRQVVGIQEAKGQSMESHQSATTVKWLFC